MHGLQHFINIFFHRVIDINCHHILARYHHFFGPLVIKGKDGCDHLLLNVVEHPGLTAGFQHGLDLLLRHIGLKAFTVHSDQLKKAAGGKGQQSDKWIHDSGNVVYGAHTEKAETLGLL